MIENEHQYKVTKMIVAEFTAALDRLLKEKESECTESLKAEEHALRRELTNLQAEMAEYEKRGDA